MKGETLICLILVLLISYIVQIISYIVQTQPMLQMDTHTKGRRIQDRNDDKTLNKG